MQNYIKWLSEHKVVIGTVALGILGVLASTGVLHASETYFQIIVFVVAVLTGVSYHADVMAVKKAVTAKK